MSFAKVVKEAGDKSAAGSSDALKAAQRGDWVSKRLVNPSSQF